MDKIISYVEQYGLAILIIALCIITFIGLLKVCKVFSWIKSSKIKKLVYYISDVALAFGGSAIYFAIYKISFSEYLVYAGAQLGFTTTLYAVYENFGLRELIKLILGLFAKWFKGNPDNKIAKQLKSLGLTEDAIAKVQGVVEGEKAKVEAQVASEAKSSEVKPISF